LTNQVVGFVIFTCAKILKLNIVKTVHRKTGSLRKGKGRQIHIPTSRYSQNMVPSTAGRK
jgi:hypothetical protein